MVVNHIALGCDRNYLLPAETLIKSICAYNQHLIFHVIHNDIPEDWFARLSAELQPLNAEIQSVHFELPAYVRNLNNREAHISDSAFLRYFIPELIAAARVLYLDVDMIVMDSLLPIFNADMQSNAIAAVEESYLGHWASHTYAPFPYDEDLSYQGGPDFSPYFNSGLLLIDTAKCKAMQFTLKAVRATCKYNAVMYGDQDILNFLFFHHWTSLPAQFNVTVSTLFSYLENHSTDEERQTGVIYFNKIFGFTIQDSVVLHYTGKAKPWLPEYYSATPLHKYWHQYHALSWADVRKMQAQFLAREASLSAVGN